MSAVDEILEGLAEAYDELRAELHTIGGVSSRLFLLRKEGETGEYEVLLEVTSGWYTAYEAWRLQTVIKVARNDTTFTEAFDLMTDFAVNTHIYSVEPRDKDRPKQTQFYYQAFGTLVNNEIFEIPVA